MSHERGDSGLCLVCRVAPCREAGPRVIAGMNTAETLLVPRRLVDDRERTARLLMWAADLYAPMTEGLGAIGDSGGR